jgi:hypothetical protein
VVLVLCGVALWVLSQFPAMDPTIAKLIKIVIVVFAILYILQAFGLFHFPVGLR